MNARKRERVSPQRGSAVCLHRAGTSLSLGASRSNCVFGASWHRSGELGRTRANPGRSFIRESVCVFGDVTGAVDVELFLVTLDKQHEQTTTNL